MRKAPVEPLDSKYTLPGHHYVAAIIAVHGNEVQVSPQTRSFSSLPWGPFIWESQNDQVVVIVSRLWSTYYAPSWSALLPRGNQTPNPEESKLWAWEVQIPQMGHSEVMTKGPILYFLVAGPTYSGFCHRSTIRSRRRAFQPYKW